MSNNTNSNFIKPLSAVFTFFSLSVFFLVFVDSNMESTSAMLSFFGLSMIICSLVLVVGGHQKPLSSFAVGAISILALTHGGGWLLEYIFEDRHYTRYLQLTDYHQAQAVAVGGVGLLLFSFTYYITSSYVNKKIKLDKKQSKKLSARMLINQIPWSVLLVWILGIFFFRGQGDIFALDNYIVLSIFEYLAQPIIILTSLKILASENTIRINFLLILFLWLFYILLVGQRQNFIPISLCTLILANKWQLLTVTKKTLLVYVVSTAILLVGMIALRENFGRQTFTTLSLTDRIEIIFYQDATIVNDDSLINTLTYDLGYRLNAGNVLLGLVVEQPTREFFWFEPITYSFSKLIPGFIWTTKRVDTEGIGELPALISNHYGLPRLDYIGLFTTVFYSMGGLHTLIFFAVISGYALTYIDIKSVLPQTLFGIIILVGFGNGILRLDNSIDALFLSLRDAFLLYVIIKVSAIIKMIMETVIYKKFVTVDESDEQETQVYRRVQESGRATTAVRREEHGGVVPRASAHIADGG